MIPTRFGALGAAPIIVNASVLFDGSGDYLTIGSNSNLALGAGAFTIEFWIRPTSSATAAVLDFRPTSTNGAYGTISYASGTLDYTANGSSQINGGSPSVGAWSHVAVCRSGTSTRMFLNGVQVGSTYTDTTTYLQTASRPAIGASGFTLGTVSLDGRISNLRVVVGTALYTGTFTPPTSPLTAISGTQLLCCANPAAITDASANAYSITVGGNAVVSPLGPF